ncbi:DUF3800 domain-containing protein [candidate division KSB1 bacterium]|nr:DUF3800 domain-containing protein [candidate division KSB1 bacterium]
MKLVFIDETSDSKNPDYLGVCGALIDCAHYGKLKKEFHRYLEKHNWEKSIEFKGSWIFSASKGCQEVPVEERIELTQKIIALNTAKKNSKISFAYIFWENGSKNEQYLKIIPLLLDKLLPKFKNQKTGKNVLALYFDERSGLNQQKLRETAALVLNRKNAILLEDIQIVRSNYQTMGLCYADIVAYLMSRIDNIEVDSQLFEELQTEYARNNMQLKKYLTSTEIISSIKNMKVYQAIEKYKK